MKKVLVLFSGGKDSLLSTILLIEQGYEVYLVHYDNSCSIGTQNIKAGYERLVKDKVKYYGIKKTDAFFRTFIKEIYNLKPREILQKYGEISISEFNCLACRLAMYVTSIIICIQEKIYYVADGARKNQLFVIEQEELLKLFTELFQQFNIKLLTPVLEYTDDYELKNEFILRGIVPKVNEAQCLLGQPKANPNVDKESLNGAINIYNKVLKEKALMLIQKYQDITIGDNYL